MAVTPAEKVRIDIPTDKIQEVIHTLQKHAIFEIIPSSHPYPLSQELADRRDQLQSELNTLNSTISRLESYTSSDGPLSALKDTRRDVTSEQFQTFENKRDQVIGRASEVYTHIQRLHTLQEEREHTTQVLETVKPLRDILLPIFETYRFLSFIPFQVHNERAEVVIQKLENQYTNIVIEEAKQLEEETIYVLAIPKHQEAELRAQLTEEVRILEIDTDLTGSFASIYTQLQDRYTEISNEIEDINQYFVSSTQFLNDFKLTHDVIESEIAAIDAVSTVHPNTEHTVYLLGWVAPERFKELEDLINTQFRDVHVQRLERDPSQAKVSLHNSQGIHNFEVVTRIMGMPKGGSLDPTPVLAIFFTLMFGLGFSEAGYALVLLLASIFLMSMPRVRTSVRKVSVVIFWASLATLVVGTLFGSWFGVNPQTVDTSADLLPHMEFLVSIGVIPLLQSLQIMNPLESILSFIAFVTGLGILHLLVGILLGAIQSYRRGEVQVAVFDYLSWAVLLLLIITTILTPIAQSLLIGVLIIYLIAMIFATGRTVAGPVKQIANGLFNLYLGLIGYLGDTLSYLRLVAIGLATAIIAQVIGTLAALAGTPLVEGGGVGVIFGYLIMIIIFVGGHLFNIALNVLGTYVNVGRLHFVEFFKQFFESGGEELQPFKKVEKYTRIRS
ncbi:MAG: V-type ATP synthase subunit I [Candidatus Paceibacteria bacterium]